MHFIALAKLRLPLTSLRIPVARDHALALEVDSSALNFDLLDLLLSEFPDARYLLTIRDCYSWCNSVFNHTLRNRGNLDALWLPMRQSRYRPDIFHHAPQEQIINVQRIERGQSQ